MFHLSPVTCLALPTFEAMLVKTAFMFRPIESRNVAGCTNTHIQTDKQTDIATHRLRGPSAVDDSVKVP